jgi:hypothetical protein
MAGGKSEHLGYPVCGDSAQASGDILRAIGDGPVEKVHTLLHIAVEAVHFAGVAVTGQPITCRKVSTVFSTAASSIQ